MNAKSKESWGLAGLGVHRGISAELNEPLGKNKSWLIQIKGHLWEFAFEVSGKKDAYRLCRFVKKHGGKLTFAELRIGANDPCYFRIASDDEGHRFFLSICGNGPRCWVTVQDADAVSLQKALEDLVREIKS